jgi:hypothetical protein
MTTGFVGVGGGEGASVLVQAKTNRTPKARIPLFIV